jgi:predicted 3-demethylubiquinone-9 3-methyltransferase (glyoxalase superfamily)
MLFPEGSPGTPGTVMSVDFTLAGKPFLGLNGGPEFKLTPAVSFMIDCETQEEIDHYWEKLLEGGEQMMCGWLTDRYGITWQVFPRILDDLINDPDREKGQRVFTAMLSMVKLDLAALLKAYNGD